MHRHLVTHSSNTYILYISISKYLFKSKMQTAKNSYPFSVF